jgi:hypothetical protein
MFLYTACYMIKYSCDSPLIGTLAKVGNFSNIFIALPALWAGKCHKGTHKEYKKKTSYSNT